MIAPREQAPHRVLLIKPSALGDVVTAVPVLRGLRRTFPDAHLAWLVNTSCAGLVREDPDLDEPILFERKRLGRAWRSPAAAGEFRRLVRALRAGQFDWCLDLQGLLRSALLAAASGAPVRAGFADAREGAPLFYTRRARPEATHTVERNVELARSLGVDARGEDMTLAVTRAGRAFAERLEAEQGLARGAYLACVPPTRWPTKLYPARHWRRVVQELSRHTRVAVLGAPGDEGLCEEVAEAGGPAAVTLAGRTSVEEMVGVIEASAGVVCCDSAAKFIAPAVGVGAVVLTGPTRLDRTGPYPRGRAIVADVPCQGCLRKRCRHVTCMQTIRPKDVTTAALEMLRVHVAGARPAHDAAAPAPDRARTARET